MSEIHMAVATDAAISYFGLALSENICRTPEGYVICKDAVIGRTGRQQYLVSSLSSGQLKDLGLDSKYRPNEVVDVWRDPEEVFSPAALSSYEGKPITDNHPNEFVHAGNHAEHSRGHVQNVRAGTIPLSSGDMPVLGDVIITDAELGEEVIQRRRRELSGGYNYHLAYDGTRLSQVGITGNHVAVVPKGRAGAEARINDAAPRKEYPMMNGKDLLIALGLKQMVTDNADPEKLAAAARASFATDAAETITKDPTLEAKDAEIATLRSELKKAEDALKAKDEKKDDDDEEEKKKEKAEDSLADKLAALDEDDDEETEEERKKRKEKEKAEDADFIQPIGEEDASRKTFLRDSLRELRPHVARSKDSVLIAKFNKMTARANDRVVSEKSDAYSVVKAAAGTKSAAANDAMADYSARLNARAEARSRGEEVK